jgi:hypothetical protein
MKNAPPKVGLMEHSGHQLPVAPASAFSFVSPLVVNGQLSADAELLLFSLTQWVNGIRSRIFKTKKSFKGVRDFYCGLLKIQRFRQATPSKNGKRRIWLIVFLIIVFSRVFLLKQKKEN